MSHTMNGQQRRGWLGIDFHCGECRFGGVLMKGTPIGASRRVRDTVSLALNSAAVSGICTVAASNWTPHLTQRNPGHLFGPP